jgi:plastocyanin
VRASLWGFALATVIALLIGVPTTSVRAGAPEALTDARATSTVESATPPTDSGSPIAVVQMRDDAPMYQPSNVIIRAGQTVEWVNAGDVSHSVVDDPGKADKPDDALLPAGAETFASGNVMPGGKFQHTFMMPGRYRYFCMSHEIDDMVGEIVVKPPAPEAAPAAPQVRAQK